jgi:hypothetical protein
MAALKERLAKKVAAQFGIDVDGTLPELLESVNDAFDLGLQVQSPFPTSKDVERAVLDIAVEAQAALSREGAKFFLMASNPTDGKPPMRALIIMG